MKYMVIKMCKLKKLFIHRWYIYGLYKTAINEHRIILLAKTFLLNSPKSIEKAAKAHINITKKGELSLLWASAKIHFLFYCLLLYQDRKAL